MDHLANTELALRLWRERITPEMVSVDLNSWGTPCGTTACFGGWLPTWPEFREMGVRRLGATDGYLPYYYDYKTGKTRVSFEVAKLLFGDRHLFATRDHDAIGRRIEEPKDLSDYALVVWRLERHIAKLKENQNGSVQPGASSPGPSSP